MKSRWILVVMGAAVGAGAGDVLAQSHDPLALRQTEAAELQFREEAAFREAARRDELAQSILAARETASSRRFSARLRSSLAENLGRVPSAALEAFANAGGLGNIDALVREVVGPKALGESAADLVFTPVTPCRIINTTLQGGPISANTTRNFFVNGNTAGTFETQGGNPGGCGIPDDATSVEMNFIAVGPAGAGDFRAFPFSTTAPLASVLNYATVPGLNIANGLAQPVCNAATTVCTFDLTVQADVSASHLVVDVVGYSKAVNKGQVKSTLTTKSRSTALILSGTCANFDSVVINAPVAGKVAAVANVLARIDHAMGTFDTVRFSLSTTNATTCTSVFGLDAYFNSVSAGPNGIQYVPMFAVREFPVPAGATTIYLNGYSDLGGNDEQMYAGAIQATFVPN